MAASHLALALGMMLSAPPSFMDESGISRTGQNGLEEYVMAAELLRRSDAQRFLAWRNQADGALRRQPGASWPESSFPGLPSQPTFLQASEISERLLQPALELIRLGNTKRTFSAFKDGGLETSFAYLPVLRNASRLGADAIHAQYARGQSARAIETWQNLSRMNRQLAEINLIHALVGFAGDTVLRASLMRQFSSWTLEDTRRIRLETERQLQAPDPAFVGIVAERPLAEAAFAQVFAGVPTLLSFLEDSLSATEMAQVRPIVSRWTDIELSQLRRDAQRRQQEFYAAINRIAGAPESQWLPLTRALVDRAQPTRSPASAPEVREYLLANLTPIDSEWIRAALVRRTQRRLVLLYTYQREFEWQTGRTPDTLQAFVPEALRLDPITGESFAWTRGESGTWEITAPGIDGSGPIRVGSPVTTSTAESGMP